MILMKNKTKKPVKNNKNGKNGIIFLHGITTKQGKFLSFRHNLAETEAYSLLICGVVFRLPQDMPVRRYKLSGARSLPKIHFRLNYKFMLPPLPSTW